MEKHSKLFWTSTATAALLQFSLPLLLRSQTPSSMADVRIEKVELTDIGPDSVQAAVRFSAVARNSATLRGLVFDEVSVNGVRVRVPPVPGPIPLRAGEEVEGLPGLQAVLTYRELDSLDPLRRAVRDGRAQVHAVVRAQVELNLFQKLALRAVGAWVTIPVDQEVPVDVPGGTIGRLASLAALTAAEPAWRASQSTRDWMRNRTALAEKVRAALPGRMVSLETRYELKSRDGEIASLRHSSSGFLIGHGDVVAPAEAVEPWNFDDSLAESLEKGDVSVTESKTEVVATLLTDGAAPARTFSLQRKELRIGRKLSDSENAISITTKHRYHVRFRNRDTNAVLLEIPALKQTEIGIELAAGNPDGDWQPAAVVRVDREENSKPALWLTEARWEGGRYRIKDPVDPTAFGSPLWIDGGVAGLLQDESSAASIDAVLKRLR